MNPNPEAIYFSQFLSDMATAYIQAEQRFIALRAVPTIPTAVRSANYYTFSKFDMNRDEAKEWEDGKDPVPFQLRLSTDLYNAKVYALGFNITREMRDAALSQGKPGWQLDLRMLAMRSIVGKLLIRRERVVLGKLFQTGLWTGLVDQTGVAGVPAANQFRKFSDAVNGTPKTTLKGYLDALEAVTFFRPNTVVFEPTAWTAVVEHPQIRAQFQYTSADSVTPEMLARALEVENVYRAAAGYNSALPGDPNAAETGTMGFVAPAGSIWIGHMNRSASTMMEPSAMYNFGWTNMVPGSPAGVAIEELPRVPGNKNDPVQGYLALDSKATGTDLGVLLTAAV